MKRKTSFQMIIQNILGIDWSTTKVEIIDKILEDLGYEAKKEYKTDDIKNKIMKSLERNKKGVRTTMEEMNVIRSNLGGCDHHDLIRVDNIITRNQNQKETEFQWGSVVLNKKWKILQDVFNSNIVLN